MTYLLKTLGCNFAGLKLKALAVNPDFVYFLYLVGVVGQKSDQIPDQMRLFLELSKSSHQMLVTGNPQCPQDHS